MSVLYRSLQTLFNIRYVNSTKTIIPSCYYAVKSTSATTAGGVVGLGKGKKKLAKMGGVEKKEIPVETDPNRLVNYVCGSNIYITGEDVQIKPDSEYPDWLWTLRTGRAPKLEELDPNTKEYWKKVRTMGMRRNNKLIRIQKFR